MDYGKKYLKYKSKYLKLREELISQGINVDEILEAELSKISNKFEQNGGGSDDIFIPSNELTEMNLTETPNVFDQEGGYVESRPGTPQDDGGIGPPIPGRNEPGDGRIPYAVSQPPPHIISTPTPAPVPAAASPSPQKSATTTNVYNVNPYFDPLYPTYAVPGYNTVVTSNPLYSTPINTFPILRRNDNYFLDDESPRRTSKRSSKRKSSKRSSKRKSSKRSSKRKSSRR